MIEAEEHKRLVAKHGRRVANRVAFASLSREERVSGGLGDFYRILSALYGSEESLPPHERSRPGDPATDFDPMCFLALYGNHPYNENSPIYHLTGGASAHWLDQLTKAREFWGKWVIHFIYKSLICGESNEVYDAIADDQGEFVTVEDDAPLCAWFEGWRGWPAWSASLSEGDMHALGEVFAWIHGGEQEPHRWPDPGTPEAEARLSGAARRSANAQKENKQ